MNILIPAKGGVCNCHVPFLGTAVTASEIPFNYRFADSYHRSYYSFVLDYYFFPFLVEHKSERDKARNLLAAKTVGLYFIRYHRMYSFYTFPHVYVFSCTHSAVIFYSSSPRLDYYSFSLSLISALLYVVESWKRDVIEM